MKTLILLLTIISISPLSFGQEVSSLDGKWAFSGSRTTFFTVKNDSLFVSLINDHTISEFEQFYSGAPKADSLTLFPCQTNQFDDKLMIVAKNTRRNKGALMSFIYSTKDSSSITYIGDVYYGDKKVPNANDNCNLQVPYCTNKLYSIKELDSIKKLKPISEISKAEVLTVFERHSEILKTKCNKCYEGFPGADINGILIDLGYNPIQKIDWNDSYAYEVSGFDNIMDKYREDEEVVAAYRKYFSTFIENKKSF
ncbi:hypothetical protein BTO06_11850 [Tenacibaculum sp. SZ-18]|uniref:hypothetical protein n=1 Tax=Tenacibaculum sp. SZ-18 TaxID=754423 RepID=UPI000C2D12AF|nr:hypothetical protein [Tenacibaculum sp. SZ-18]AUC15799.1 hypothetical protein BTO06_11850 [Tenacibaculum sp. SZ-18]